MSNPEAPDGFLSRWSRRKVGARQGAAAADAPPTATATATAGASAALAASTTSSTTAANAVTNPVTSATVQSAQMAAGATRQSAELPAKAAESSAENALPLPTWDDVAALTPQSDFSRFVARQVDPRMRNAALKTLFSDPHFNVMDGLDTYIEDYGLPDPLPEGMLRQMNQAHALGLFDHEKELPEDEATLTAPQPAPSVDDIPAAPDSMAATEPINPTDTADAPTAPDAHAEIVNSADSTPRPVYENPDLRLQQDHAAGRTGPEPGPGQDGAGPDRRA